MCIANDLYVIINMGMAIILSMAAGFSVIGSTRLRSVPNTKPAGNRLPHVFSHMTSTPDLRIHE